MRAKEVSACFSLIACSSNHTNALLVLSTCQALKDFDARKKAGDADYQSLGLVITEKMPTVVGPTHWSRAVDIHRRYLLNMQRKKRPWRATPTLDNSSHAATPSQSQIQPLFQVPPSPFSTTMGYGDFESKQGAATTSQNPLLSPFTLSSYTDIPDSFSLNHYPVHHHHYQIKKEDSDDEADETIMDDDSKQSAYLEDTTQSYQYISSSDVGLHHDTTELDDIKWGSSMDQIPSIIRQTAETLLMVQKDTTAATNYNNMKLDPKG
jgi:hypothetical protein